MNTVHPNLDIRQLLRMALAILIGYIASVVSALILLFSLSAIGVGSGKGEGYILSQIFLVCIVACAFGNFLIGYLHGLKRAKRPWLTWLFTPAALLAVFFFIQLGPIAEVLYVRWRLIIFIGSSRICVGSQGSRDVIQSLKMQPLTTMLALPWSEGRATRGRDPSAVSRPCAEVG